MFQGSEKSHGKIGSYAGEEETLFVGFVGAWPMVSLGPRREPRLPQSHSIPAQISPVWVEIFNAPHLVSHGT